ncbi:protein serine/threonine phosphatase with extracellular sensor [Caldithrix abyssi DSM 13497]|uniref:Protein serine/threonine phosphatase with extracellular sensor n=1 Tax=Caldithrix abyssi DSM 13497 TaxID=880073 RepID=H1XSU4_CALAY|nr:SpoIIE family protein phosphatase [Caldithrix abyssi]APF20270.1 Serine phosphatase RsbU, regulator of sigma subunit [Caldithrix abyssi DSM 13497]EHO40321.1 protein serine/threonine phosphatase with extracellular sensor [Caldithrix abyssi DSM 13497]
MFKNVRKEEITIPAQMSYLTQVRDFIERIGKKFRFDDKIINSFKLVVDEACTNIIRHGYRDIKNGEITIKAIIRRLSLTIIIIDQGISYDPRQANTPDLDKYIKIGKKGGLGILMMRKLMDDMQYAVTERGNELRLTKFRDQTHEPLLLEKWNALNLKAKYSILASIIFTIIALLFFVPIYYNTEKNIRNDIYTLSATAGEALAANIVDDMLAENSAILFEKAYKVRASHPTFIYEVFIVDADSSLLAWSNPEKIYPFKKLAFKPVAEKPDTVQRAVLSTYQVNDTLTVKDLSIPVKMTNGLQLGEVHVWVNEKTIEDLVFNKKLRLIIVLMIILIAGYVPIFFLIHRILQPFHSLAEWVRQVVHGKVDQDEIDIDASDEIGEIAQAFNEMTNKFREAQVTLVEQQKLQKELQVAQEIQQMLLPSDFPKVEGYDIASYYEAAKEVGGDLFDFVEVDDDTIGICVADVSGKGVPGSMIMTMIRTALRLEARGNKNPADVLARVNEFVVDDMKRGMFVTMFYVVLDSRNREIHFASAGHNPMILYRNSTKQTYYLNPPGFPVGIQLPDPDLFRRTITSESIRLREDDILVLYTDGVTEAMNRKRELYREERFLDSIRRNAHLSVVEFIKTINKELKEFTGGAPQNDDITVVAIREKMMPSEVIIRTQQELKKLIDSGMKVKDALAKLKVSPAHYYRYKNIIESKGLNALKEFLSVMDDPIEKKHLSIEVKTKIYDIVRKHPEFGPKLIAYELRRDEYGNIKVDPDRIYDELVRMRLNTETLRRRWIEKGGTRPLKQPGTPLLTLDGQVILNFESSAQVVAQRMGKTIATPVPEEERAHKPLKRSIQLVSEESEKETTEEQAEKTAEEVSEKEASPAAETAAPETVEAAKTDDADEARVETPLSEKAESEEDSEEIVEEELVEKTEESSTKKETIAGTVEQSESVTSELAEAESGPENEPDVEEAAPAEIKEDEERAKEPAAEAKTDQTPEETAIASDMKKIEDTSAFLQSPGPAEPESAGKELIGNAYSAAELRKMMADKYESDRAEEFFRLVKDDYNQIIELLDSAVKSDHLPNVINKINILLKIIKTHPMLKKDEMQAIRQLFVEMHSLFSFYKLRFDELEREEILQGVKLILNYFKNNNIFASYDKLIETINAVGIMNFQLIRAYQQKQVSADNPLQRLREQLKNKKIISDDAIVGQKTK